MSSSSKPKLSITSTNPSPHFPSLEEKVLEYWDAVNAFSRSVTERPESKPYVFYDGPPFATGLPHYGHLLGSIMKDIIPRYFTMKGFRVERRWGWDCHGLPIENIIEKELDLKGGKKGIEAYGIAKFNAACRQAILRYDQEWRRVIKRIGRWVDMEHSYKTMDFNYMESVWWAFASLYQKGLVYQGKKVILYCPRCATPLSNFEIAMDNSYTDITEESTTYKFPVVGTSKPTFLLAWSTTPWNKIATPALAVNPHFTYVLVEQSDEHYYLAESRLSMLHGDYQIISRHQGKELESLQFTQLYDFFPDRQGKRAGVVVADDFVTDTEGTGIVTLAIYGEDDYRVMQKHNIQLVEHVDEMGKFKPEVTPWAGQYILKANQAIDEDLEKRGLIYQHAPITHSVPACYRCNTRLYYAPLPAWFIDVQKLKPDLLKNNQLINWFPAHLKEGRFGKGLATAPDWNISRSRYWGTPIPIWIGRTTGKIRVISSLKELIQHAVDPEKAKTLTDIHREYLDDLPLYVDDDHTEIGDRIKEVFDCWVESGSMSFAAEHYPFEHAAKFEARFPAQYICEYIAQTRAWFYTLHVCATALFGKPAFENALTTGTIMAEDGQKMSKSKKNYPDPMAIIDEYGVDSLRLYFASSPIMKTAQNVNFSRDSILDIKKKVFNIAWNIFAFYRLYDSGQAVFGYPQKPIHLLDRWLISRIENLTQAVTQAMDHYDVVSASRLLMDFVDEFSTWWLRLSRDRLRDQTQSQSCLQVFRTVLRRWLMLLAPFAPFFTEAVYQNLYPEYDSIHLASWPQSKPELIDHPLETSMRSLQQIVEKAHAERKAHNLKTRQPLASVTVISPDPQPEPALIEILLKEINVKTAIWKKGSDLQVSLDSQLTPELIAEGEARDIIRKINDARKKSQVGLDQSVTVTLPSWPVAWEAEIKKRALVSALVHGDTFSLKLP